MNDVTTYDAAAMIRKTMLVQASPSDVWSLLASAAGMERWLTDDVIKVESDMQPGSTIFFSGTLHGRAFRDKGFVLDAEPERLFRYRYLGEASRLPDVPGNYTVFEFRLAPVGNATELTFTGRNFVTESIYAHNRFYWNVALEVLKKVAEESHS
jgi:uncharacterized protein YndB with AHSA1/START domain